MHDNEKRISFRSSTTTRSNFLATVQQGHAPPQRDGACLGPGVFSPYRAVNTGLSYNKMGNVRNNEAHSCNHCCSGKATIITYSVCACVCVCVCLSLSLSLSVALVIQHAMHVRHIVICGLSRSTIFFHIISWRFSGGKVTEHKMCFDFLYNICLKHVSF
jgi:hypothetical protein